MLKIIDLQSKDRISVIDPNGILDTGNKALWKRKQIVVLFTGGKQYLHDMTEVFINAGCLLVSKWSDDVDIVVRDESSYSKRIIRDADKAGVPIITKPAVFRAWLDDECVELLSRTMLRNTSKKHSSFGLSLTDYK